MKFRFYDFQRIVYTFFCKLFVEVARGTRFQWTVSVIDFFIKKRGQVLAKAAAESMYQTKKWQKKAEHCIVAFHEFEKYIQSGDKPE